MFESVQISGPYNGIYYVDLCDGPYPDIGHHAEFQSYKDAHTHGFMMAKRLDCGFCDAVMPSARAEYLGHCLEAFTSATLARDKWRGFPAFKP